MIQETFLSLASFKKQIERILCILNIVDKKESWWKKNICAEAKKRKRSSERKVLAQSSRKLGWGLLKKCFFFFDSASNRSTKVWVYYTEKLKDVVAQLLLFSLLLSNEILFNEFTLQETSKTNSSFNDYQPTFLNKLLLKHSKTVFQ